jgi:hypothetical protein
MQQLSLVVVLVVLFMAFEKLQEPVQPLAQGWTMVHAPFAVLQSNSASGFWTMIGGTWHGLPTDG